MYNLDLVKQDVTNGYQGLHSTSAINSDMTVDGFGVKFDPEMNSQHLRL